jgi:hypothetical protein
MKFIQLFIHILLLSFFLTFSHASSINPTWISNSYFETNPAIIKQNINTVFGAANPITKTIPFVKAYTSPPQLAFGIKNYRGIFIKLIRK